MTRLGSGGQEVAEISVLELQASAPGGAGVTELGDAQAGAASVITPTLAAVAGQLTWIAGFSVDGLGATAGSVIEVTLAGPSVTRRYKLTVPAGAGVAIAPPVRVEFARPIPAAAVNTPIVLTVPSFGAGNTSSVAEVHGFRK